MATFRFLHCADLHLDSPLRGLEGDPDAPVAKIRGATREAFTNVIDFALGQRLDFVVAAGDLYDGDWQDWRTGQFLIGQIARLNNAGIPFIAIRGNHDAESVITRRLRMPGNDTRLLDHSRPETYRLANLPVSIHGQSFATRAVLENLALAYPAPDAGRFNIGLLHSSVGEREGHGTYASCPVDQLRAHGYHYWALGHIHRREVLSREPWIVFPGNTQGRHINETGPKGATLVTVNETTVVDVVPLAFDSVRWTRINVALAPEADEDVALNQVRAALAEEFERSEGRTLAVRLTISGACTAHDTFVRDLGAAREKVNAERLTIAGADVIWFEKIQFATTPLVAAATQIERTDATGQLIRAMTDITADHIIEDIQSYARAMLGKANPLRAVLGDDHVATKAANGDVPEELRRRAQDLLLGSLDG